MSPPPGTVAAPAAVALDGVVKRYGAVTAVNRVSFAIEPGTFVTLLGPSGCGKTSTLRMIAGLELADEGAIRIDGADVTHRPAAERDVSMVFQSYALFPHMTVLENVAYGLEVGRRRRRAEARRAALEGLALVGLEGLGERLPSELSGGQQQRVAVARALVLEPKVLLFDEPLSNLDARLRRRMREDVRALQQRLGYTAVYVTHDQSEALAISDRILVMDQAVVVQDGAPRTLYEEPASVFVAQFMGDANVLDAEIVRVEGEQAAVRLGTLVLWLPHRGLGEGAVKLAVRPHAIRLSPADARAPGLDGRVARAVYLGTHVEYAITTDLPVELLATVVPTDATPHAVGDRVRVAFDRAGACLVPG